MDGRVLLIGPSRVGDGVLVTGLVERLVRDGARLTLACGPAAMPLFANVAGIERRIAVVKRRCGLHWVGLWGATVGTAWHAVGDLRGSALAYLVRARERRVFRPSVLPGHRLEALAAALGVPPAEPVLRLAPTDVAAGTALMPETPFLALGPCANWSGKVWPAERFVGLARALTGPGGALAGARVAVLGGPGEKPAARPIAEALPGAVDLVGRTTLLEA
ncbi:MAG: glycosyltransferase family 9 protein, partial [Alphaproteobacteria bacterium]